MRKQLKEEEETDEETTTTRSPYESYRTVLVTLIITVLILLSTAIWQHTREPKEKQQTSTEAAKETSTETATNDEEEESDTNDEEEESDTNGWLIGGILIGFSLAIVGVYMAVRHVRSRAGMQVVVETPVQLLEKEKEALLRERVKWKQKADDFKRDVMMVKLTPLALTDAEKELEAEIQRETVRLDLELLELKRKIKSEIRKEKREQRRRTVE